MIKSNIRKLTKTEINKALFSNFNREQRVTRCWRKAEGEWVLKDIAFTENWRDDQYEELVRYLVNTVDTGGTVWGVFKSERLIGFASLENKFFGSQSQYLQLSSIHVSKESRGEGIGRQLFFEAYKRAAEMGAGKLYISAHSSEETMAFYHRLGCVEAKEYNETLVAQEPYDCQLEYVLDQQ